MWSKSGLENRGHLGKAKKDQKEGSLEVEWHWNFIGKGFIGRKIEEKKLPKVGIICCWALAMQNLAVVLTYMGSSTYSAFCRMCLCSLIACTLIWERSVVYLTFCYQRYLYWQALKGYRPQIYAGAIPSTVMINFRVELILLV